MINELYDLAQAELRDQDFDCLAVAVLDFKKKSFTSFEINPYQNAALVYDLASLTKPLTLGLCYLSHPEYFKEDELLLLNHQAGLPVGGRLGRSNWRDLILSYPIRATINSYSDFSALRLMLDLEKKSGKSLYSLGRESWDEEVYHWSQLPPQSQSPIYGMRNKRPINKQVHDDNAFYLKEELAHAGLFASLKGLSQTLLNADKNNTLLKQMQHNFKSKINNQRFLAGWDTVSSVDTTLAGPGCSLETFGHLGFTGTSIWIDSRLGLGVVILTNATMKFWYTREKLNRLRKKLGAYVWQHARSPEST